MLKLEMGRVAVVFGLLGTATVGLAAAGADTASKPAMGGLMSRDRDFLREAAQGGMAEVQMGQYMRDHAQSEDVKRFAQRMIDDHTKANDQLQSLASKKSCALPKDMAAKHHDMQNKLAQQSGYELDRSYIRGMVKDHEGDVAAFQRAAQGAQDVDIRQFAQATLPTLQDHLKQAREIDQKLKTNQSATR